MMIEHALFPKVVVSGRMTSLSASGLEPQMPYTVNVASKRKPQHLWERELESDGEGHLRWTDAFPSQDEYVIDMLAPGARGATFSANIYAVPPVWAGLLPLRCDLHIHTYYSDGRESPLDMAIRGRELGLDVIAITDHNRYAPSLEAIQGAKRIGLDITCLPGEEASFDNWHLLSIAASGPVRDVYDSADGAKEIAETVAALEGANLRHGLEPEEYASVKWAAEHIRRQGGRAFLAHPYWVSRRRYHLDLRLYDQLVADGAIDGVELLGDVDFVDNLLSVAHYQRHLAQGYMLPVLGCSDTHAAREKTYGCHWSLVLARDPSQANVLDAIQARRSVACSTAGPNGLHEGFRAYGPVELVEYAAFLDREFFPLHDALCAEEAKQAWDMLNGSRVTARDLGAEMRQLYRRCFAVSE